MATAVQASINIGCILNLCIYGHFLAHIIRSTDDCVGLTVDEYAWNI